MAVKTNDVQAQQALDRKQPAGELALRLLTVAQTRHVVAGGLVGGPKFTLDKSTAE